MKKSKWLALLLVLVMAISTLAAGCGNKAEDKKEETKTEVSTTDDTSDKKEDSETADQDAAEEEEVLTELTFPLTEEKKEITYWVGWSNSYVDGPNDLPSVQAIEEKTNVHVNWILVDGNASERFGLMLASGDVPDVVNMGALGNTYPGGDMKGIEDGVFLDCEELIRKYMPNYRAILESNEMIMLDAVEDDGKPHLIYWMQGADDGIRPQNDWTGLCIRQDWLDACGLDMPVTIDDWHTVLTAFKEQMGATAPLATGPDASNTLNPFISAFGVLPEYYVEDGVVKYGPLEEGYKQWIELYRQWYSEGLIDPNFVTADGWSSNMVSNDLLGNGATGAFNTTAGFMGDAIYKMGITQDENVNIVPVLSPVLNEGDTIYSGAATSVGSGLISAMFISAETEDPELVAKWVDYQFSREAMEYHWYGIEGVSYERTEDGGYQFTDLVFENPDGFTVQDAWKMYASGLQIGWYNWQSYDNTGDPEPVEAMKLWTTMDRSKVLYTGKVNFTEEENIEYNNLFTAIDTLVNEKTINYIMGTESMDTYDEFIQSLYDYGVERCIELKQKLYDTYNARAGK